ncbi:MAG: hypothetical protein ACXABY_26250, partial [Candidatus Thorarchaeota archaeon]
ASDDVGNSDTLEKTVYVQNEVAVTTTTTTTGGGNTGVGTPLFSPTFLFLGLLGVVVIVAVAVVARRRSGGGAVDFGDLEVVSPGPS